MLSLVRRLQSRTDVTVVLASTSPRRKQILQEQLQCPHLHVRASPFDERTLRKGDFASPAQFVMRSAQGKAEDVFDAMVGARDHKPCLLVIGADTIVVLPSSAEGAERILEKPADASGARKMLRELAGRSHTVITGVALVYRDHTDGLKKKVKTFYESTEVRMAQLDDAEIDAYIATGDPLDKAGSYGIQSIGGCLIEGIDGDYSNVVGFPLHKFCVQVSALRRDIFGEQQ